MGSGSFHFAVAGIGIVCAVAWAFGKRREHPRASRVPDAWPAVSVLGLYFLSEILLEPWLRVIGAAYQVYYALGNLIITLNVYFLYQHPL